MIHSYVYDNSILSALSPQIFTERCESLRKRTFREQVSIAIKAVTITYALKSLCIYSFSIIKSDSQFLSKFENNLTITSLVWIVLLVPLVEEVAFRFICMNSIRIVQENLTHFFCTRGFLKSDTLKYFLTPSFRIILSSLIFGLAHFVVSPNFSQIKIVRVALIILFPAETLIFERTNNFGATVVAHSWNNLLAFSVSIITNKLKIQI